MKLSSSSSFLLLLFVVSRARVDVASGNASTSATVVLVARIENASDAWATGKACPVSGSVSLMIVSERLTGRSVACVCVCACVCGWRPGRSEYCGRSGVSVLVTRAWRINLPKQDQDRICVPEAAGFNRGFFAPQQLVRVSPFRSTNRKKRYLDEPD